AEGIEAPDRGFLSSLGQIDVQVDEHADERRRGQEACKQHILRDGPREEGGMPDDGGARPQSFDPRGGTLDLSRRSVHEEAGLGCVVRWVGPARYTVRRNTLKRDDRESWLRAEFLGDL